MSVYSVKVRLIALSIAILALTLTACPGDEKDTADELPLLLFVCLILVIGADITSAGVRWLAR